MPRNQIQSIAVRVQYCGSRASIGEARIAIKQIARYLFSDMDNCFSLSLSSSLYSLAAIKRAMHDLSSLGSFSLTPTGPNYIISICGELSVSHDELRKSLLKAILDHDVRLQPEQEFGAIRQVIVEQAVNPITNEELSRKIASLTFRS